MFATASISIVIIIIMPRINNQ